MLFAAGRGEDRLCFGRNRGTAGSVFVMSLKRVATLLLLWSQSWQLRMLSVLSIDSDIWPRAPSFAAVA